MTEAAKARRSHVVGGEHSRCSKARKVLALLGEAVPPSGGSLLDIGAGSGWMSHFFAELAGLSVTAVDVADQREVRDGFVFRVVDGVDLPFDDGSFDLVVSNHVVEHVGDEAAQRRHLAQIARVLKPGGTAYFAVPNRWSLTEPHYRLPFLSWPRGELASRYLRATGRGRWYDCRPLGPLEVRRLVREAGFECQDVGMRGLVELVRIEAPSLAWLLPALRLAGRLAGPVPGLLSPTQIFLLRRTR